MIGQEELENKLYSMIDNNTFPRFIALTGEVGMGKKMLARLLAKHMNATLYELPPRAGVDDIRNIIETAYKQTSKVVYLIPEINYISNSAENALLKVTEEPPNNAYFIVTIADGRNIKNTLKSRAVTFRLAPYSISLLQEFAKQYGVEEKLVGKILTTLTTPGDIIEFANGQQNYQDLETFTQLVLDNIGEVGESNAFKIADKIAFDEKDVGFNLSTFWILFNNLCMKQSRTSVENIRPMYYSYIRITNSYQSKLHIIGINKKSLFDMWILEIKETYTKYS